MPVTAGDEAERLTPDVVSALTDQVGRHDLSTEPRPGEPSSSPEIALPRYASVDIAAVVDTDPWAYAFAESLRVPVPAAVSAPLYRVEGDHDQVRFFLDRFTGSRRGIVGTWLARSGRYLGMIRDVLKKRGLPEELAFTAMIESGFDPAAVSRVGAKGLWQFMAATARRYGLRVDHWVDERLDPEKSTVAAASYLRDLYSQFGSWALAQAAYNAGEVTVARAIRSTGSTDFWTLARSRFLRQETKEFVPQIHAATMIGRDPPRYGFDPAAPAFDRVDRISVPPTTDLRRLSAAAGVSLDALQALNPVLVRGVTPPGSSYDLKIPPGTQQGMLAALTRKGRPAAVGRAGSRASRAVDVHVVRPRDTVSSIAKQYGVSIGDVLRWNKLARQDTIRPGDRLRVVDIRPSGQRDGQGGFR